MHNTPSTNKTRALIFDVKRDCSEDGPGIRTTVFFKGCPLSCVWCQNPEGLTKTPQISYHSHLCQPEKCKQPADDAGDKKIPACFNVCDENCFQLSSTKKIILNQEKCTHCNKCFEACPTGALEPAGYWIDLDELLYRIIIDKPFFQSTGGGVTLSGGEVTQQMDFAGQLLKALKKENINTAIETSGFFNFDKFSKKMLPFIDRIYFDLKLINETESRKYTGQSNKLILKNFKRLVEYPHITIIPRIPLIPDITTKEKNLKGIAQLLKSLNIDSATLLPYNPLWQDKINQIGLERRYNRTTVMTEEEKKQCVVAFSDASL